MEEKTKIIKASLELQQRVGTGVVDAEVVKQAQQVIEDNDVDFGPIALPLLKDLQDSIALAKKGEGDPKSVVESITRPIMNLKGNAGVFKFPLISDMTGTVLALIEHVGRIDDDILVIVDNLHKASTVAVAQKLVDKKNPIAAELAKEFEGVCKRYMEKRT